MSKQPAKHFPVPTPETAPYWEACHNHQLLIQKCADCGKHQFYPRTVCSHCTGGTLEWAEASGRGEIVSYTIMHRAVSKAYAGGGVTVLALIRLEEDVQMMSNIIGCDPEQVCTGMSVEIIFEDWSDEISMPMFRPADQQ
ncbi:MAG: OB-fold domain-containing protein [Proteobacteria bacterium]|nr:OB-fold domain-containing protein [Pseudomonadota bacterium]